MVEGESEFHKRSFLVYNIERGKADRIFLYEQEEYSGLLEITQVDHLTTMAIWATGSATIITLFRVIDKEIKLVLEIGSKFSPEIVDLSGDFIPEILISRGEWIVEKDGHREFRPVKTSIYKFQKDKSKYVETQVVPWKDRFTISEQKPK
ncbi:MAG: hypothetical protein MPW14_17920 [Candidatus Manganitrophus sp.]|nr:MAG: hypothetical protein MPW14_17920 [Candidatus Manganitrophus sp.]